jgi:hypothetical protein
VRKLVVGVLLLLLTLIGVGLPSAAFAAPVTETPVSVVASSALTHSVQYAVPMKSDDPSGGPIDPNAGSANYIQSPYVPLTRWNAFGMHSRLNWFNAPNAAINSMNRGNAGNMLSLGTGMMGSARDWAVSATSFDVFKTVFGYQIDHFVGQLGTIILNNTAVFGFLFLAVVVGSFWRAWRHGGKPWGKVLQVSIVVALVVVMSTQSAQSAPDAQPHDNYKPLYGTPVWIAKTLSSTIDGAAGLGSAQLIEAVAPKAAVSQGGYCSGMYRASMELLNEENFPSNGTKVTNEVMNVLWWQTAFPTYTAVQFGSDNNYGQNAACQMLERQSTQPQWTKLNIIAQMYGGAPRDIQDLKAPDYGIGNRSNTMMMDLGGNNEANDRAMVVLLSCSRDGKDSFSVNSGWDTKADGSPWITANDCKDAWAKDKGDDLSSINGDVFNIPGSDEAVKLASNDQVANAIDAIHGENAGTTSAGVVDAIIFIIAAFFIAAIYFGMSLIIFGAKAVLLVMSGFLIMVLIVGAFRRQPLSELLGGTTKRLFNIALFAFGATLLFVVLAMFTVMFSNVGLGFFRQGTLGSLLWTAASPVGAVAAVHFAFTKLLRLPSPVSPRGALAWGTAGGAIGGAVGAGVANGLMNRASGAARSAGKGLAGKALGGTKVGNLMGLNAKKAPGAGDAGSRPVSATEAAQKAESKKGQQDLEKLSEDEKLTKDELTLAKREARAAHKAENPGKLSSLNPLSHSGKAARLAEQTARMEALQATVASAAGESRGGGAPPAGLEYLRKDAAQRTGGFNADNFALEGPQPDIDHGPSIAAASWGDLNRDGQRAATKALQQQRHAARQAEAAHVIEARTARAAALNENANWRERAVTNLGTGVANAGTRLGSSRAAQVAGSVGSAAGTVGKYAGAGVAAASLVSVPLVAAPILGAAVAVKAGKARKARRASVQSAVREVQAAKVETVRGLSAPQTHTVASDGGAGGAVNEQREAL